MSPEASSRVLDEEIFRQLLAHETSRATRYQDFFSICLIKPDLPEDSAAELERALSKKIAEFLRATDTVGRLEDGTAVLLLHTASPDALRVAERIRTSIEKVAFPATATGTVGQVTLSVGEVSFPQDGSNDAVLLARARAHLQEATRRGGNQVVHAAD